MSPKTNKPTPTVAEASSLGRDSAAPIPPRQDAAATNRTTVAEASSLGAAPELHFFSPVAETENRHGDLPHWRQPGVIYFVTFRTADSLPRHVWEAWKSERCAWLAAHPEPWDTTTEQTYRDRFSRRLQRWLDQAQGECRLRDESIRIIVASALNKFHQQRYWLDEWIVAPNHVHALVAPSRDWELSQILHSWKSYTSLAINRALGRKGPFWQKETYDHIVRNEAALEKIRAYIRAHCQ